MIYYDGNGVTRDYAKAYSLYKQAYDKGLKVAASKLGQCYEYGHGVEANDENVVDGKYVISRPFLLVNKKDNLSEKFS